MTRRLFFASPASVMYAGIPGKLTPIPTTRKRLLIIANADVVHGSLLQSLIEALAGMGYEGVGLLSFDHDCPDYRVYDLDGVPQPDSGLLEELKAAIAKHGT